MNHGELFIQKVETAAVAVVPPQEVSIVDIIGKISQTPNLTLESIGVLERLVALQERREDQVRKERFFEALRLCQMEMPRVQKNGLIDPKCAKVPYAKLEDLDACIRPIYQRHGFSVVFDAPQSVDGAKIRNSAKFSCAGHMELLEITAAPSNRNTGRLSMTNAQAVKQTITECRRHLLEMFFNVITVGADEMTEDDPITQDQADSIRTRMNDLSQRTPGILLTKLCEMYGVKKPEEITVSQYAAVVASVETTERQKGAR